MQAWLESVAGPEYASALMWTIAALIALLVILLIVRIIRGLTFGTFVAGGRNRKARLAVMDATAVDSQRRLVLVRRDDVEHLILIGGPTDVVVEQNIRLLPPSRRVAADETADYAPAPVATLPEKPVAAPGPPQQPPIERPAAPPAPPPPSQPAPAERAAHQPPPPAPERAPVPHRPVRPPMPERAPPAMPARQPAQPAPERPRPLP